MRLSARAAVVGERALGDDVVGARRHAEVRAAVPDHHVRRSSDHCACEHLQLALPTRQSLWACGNARRQRSPPCHSSLLAKKGTESRALRRAALTTRSKPSETIFTSAPARAAELEKRREAGVDPHGADLLVERLGRRAQQRDLSRHAFARGNSVRLAKLPRPARHAGSAKRSSRRSVGSSGATVPSKSTKTRQFGAPSPCSIWRLIRVSCLSEIGAVDCRAPSLPKKI